VDVASAAVGNVEQRPDNYAVEQGDKCIQIEPVGDATRNVSAYYDYRNGSEGAWSSHGRTDRQAPQVSQLSVYRGSEGDSLVFLHDALNDDDRGGAISMTISGLPDIASWEVQDDDYDDREDRFQHDGYRSQIDWMWATGRTDGGAVRGVAASDYDEIMIDPAFSEDSYGASEGWEYADDDLQWRVGTGEDTLVPLDQTERVTFRQGVCRGTSPPEADLTADPVTLDAGENVTRRLGVDRRGRHRHVPLGRRRRRRVRAVESGAEHSRLLPGARRVHADGTSDRRGRSVRRGHGDRRRVIETSVHRRRLGESDDGCTRRADQVRCDGDGGSRRRQVRVRPRRRDGDRRSVPDSRLRRARQLHCDGRGSA